MNKPHVLILRHIEFRQEDKEDLFSFNRAFLKLINSGKVILTPELETIFEIDQAYRQIRYNNDYGIKWISNEEFLKPINHKLNTQGLEVLTIYNRTVRPVAREFFVLLVTEYCNFKTVYKEVSDFYNYVNFFWVWVAEYKEKGNVGIRIDTHNHEKVYKKYEHDWLTITLTKEQIKTFFNVLYPDKR